jgi:hypothetical protein
MVPVNQVILGGDPLLGSSMLGNNIEEQLQLLDRYRQNLENAKNMKQQIQQAPQRLIWDDIDLELQPMSDEQKSILFQNEEYVETYTRIQGLVNIEILNLVKAKIESTQEGNELLRNQLKILRKLKGKIIEDTNREMEMFRRFKEFSKHNPEVTYDEFIKNNI